MNRLLSKLRQQQRPESVHGNGNGHVTRVQPRAAASRHGYVVTAAESAPCNCPDFCERDHGNE
jgi:hypothetical protein